MKAGSIHQTIIIASVSVVLIGGLMIYAGLFAQASLIQSFDSTLNPATAYSMFAFTGNVSQNETVNVTVNSSYVVNFAFGINGGGIPAGYNNVSLYSYYNGSDVAMQNFTYAVNQNATLASIIIATNNTMGGGSNMTHITWGTTGKAGNGQLTLSDTLDNGAWSSPTLAGGVDGMTAYASTKTNVNSAFVILGVLLIFAGIGGLLATVLGFVGQTGKRQ